MKHSAHEVQKMLSYNRDTGAFTWKTRDGQKRWNSVHSGQSAGGVDSHGYIQISINGRRYLAHRLAWLIIHGQWPSSQIDHVNGNRKDNRAANLREVASAVNAQNMRAARKDNSSGLLGVSFYKRTGKFIARIMLNGKSRCLGVFGSAEAAHETYLAAKRSFHDGCTL